MLNAIGLNNFAKLKKLRIEHLEGNQNEKAWSDFLTQLQTNSTITHIKIEHLFPEENSKLLLLRDAIDRSRMQKMILWISSCS